MSTEGILRNLSLRLEALQVQLTRNLANLAIARVSTEEAESASIEVDHVSCYGNVIHILC